MDCDIHIEAKSKSFVFFLRRTMSTYTHTYYPTHEQNV